jgi:hypothetical protein
MAKKKRRKEVTARGTCYEARHAHGTGHEFSSALAPAPAPPPWHDKWHRYEHAHLVRLRQALEARLGGCCSYCGLSRADGVNLQFHHHQGRSWRNSQGHPVTARQLSWSQRLYRYRAEIASGKLLYLACDQTGNNCHETCKRHAPSQPQELYEYDPTPNNNPF